MSLRITKNIRVNTLARVEGEGALEIKFKGDAVADVKLKIYEPPRLFEAFLRGRFYEEAIDITSRICGICPVAYQMSATHALEKALGIEIDPAVRMLRRLLYCGEWIESHTLHVYMLHAPDFLGYPDVIAMARDHREIVEKALRLKKVGNRIVSLLGGREIHPVSVAVGGFYKIFSRADLQCLTEDLKWALDASLETIRLVAGFEFPAFQQDYEFVALRHPGEYPFNEGRLVSSSGLDTDAADYETHFREIHVAHSNALHSVFEGRGSYLVGPMARFNLNYDSLPAVVKEAAHSAGLAPPVKNPFKSIVVRAVEIAFACSEALRVVKEYQPPAQARIKQQVQASVGQAITEAPRGILYQRYDIAANGLIVSCKIVPPTSQNQGRIEDDLRSFAANIVGESTERATWLCEQAVRNYDPCISCATHALRIELRQSAS